MAHHCASTLITQLQHEHDNAHPVHPQRYEDPHRGRRAGTSRIIGALTKHNTRPIRLHVDFASLFEEHAPRYSQCWRAGDWFRRGSPTSSLPPNNSKPTCHDDDHDGVTHTDLDKGCWGLCQTKDVITPTGRSMMMKVVRSIVRTEVSSFFAVLPVSGNLTFVHGTSRYEKALRSRGQRIEAACASDCALSNVVVSAAYCTAGVEADAVLSVIKPPSIPGIAGTGSSCASDQNGRPVWLVFAWHSPIDSLAEHSLEENIAAQRGLVLHEIFHGLGFSNSFFNYARDSTGRRKNLLALRPVVDEDGEADQVWHFVRGRAYAMAADYFNCHGGNGSWEGVPLMGQPEQGRASHWETRIMRDDVMSYGGQGTVSSITLAAMEDLGFYIANYSAAQCLHWGFKQGCDYVMSRCSRMKSVWSVPAGEVRHCHGDPYWGSHLHPYIEQKCARGNDPCLVTGMPSVVCDPQCDFENERVGCTASPQEPVEVASLALTYNDMLATASTNWTVWLATYLAAIGVLSVLSSIRGCFCPRGPCLARCYALVLGVVTCLASLFGILVTYSLSHQSQVEDFLLDQTTNTPQTEIGGRLAAFLFFLKSVLPPSVRRPTILSAASSAFFAIFCCTSVTLVAVLSYQRWILLCVKWLLLACVIAEVCMAMMILYWIYRLDGLPSDSINAFLGSNLEVIRRIEVGEAGSEIKRIADSMVDRASVSFSLMEGYICMAYTTCCRDTAVEKCMRPAEGIATGLVPSDLQDPSSPEFCSCTTGAPRGLLVQPTPDTCAVLGTALGGGFSLGTCQHDFCSAGVDGYISFIKTIVAWVQRNAMIGSVILSVTILVQLMFACNAGNVRWLKEGKQLLEHESELHQTTKGSRVGRGRRVVAQAERRRWRRAGVREMESESESERLAVSC